MKRFLLTAVLCLAVAGCAPSREARDQKLYQACIASVKALSYGELVFEDEKKLFADETAYNGVTLRRVTIEADVSEDSSAYDRKTYTCWFEDRTTMFGWQAKFHHMEFDGRRLGNYEGTLKGDLQDMMKINDVTEGILY